MSSSTVPPGGANSASGFSTDIYQRVLMRNVEAAIEDIILIDEPSSPSALLPKNTSMFSPMGDLEIDDNPSVMPMLYVESRADSDPIVLDEDAVAVGLEDFVDRSPTVQNIPGFDTLGMIIEGELREDPIVPNSFDPSTFDPFDPCIDDLMSLALV